MAHYLAYLLAGAVGLIGLNPVTSLGDILFKKDVGLVSAGLFAGVLWLWGSVVYVAFCLIEPGGWTYLAQSNLFQWVWARIALR